MTGRFIVLEGGDGSGKTTQARLLTRRVQDHGREVVHTFEPGATSRGMALRRFVLDDPSPLDPRAELLVMAADRAQHVAEVIRPALAHGAVVVCDRFVPSSLAYQGIGRGLGVEDVLKVNEVVTYGVTPDIVVVLDVDDEVAATRRPPLTGDRLEQAGRDFHVTVREAYRKLAVAHGWVLIDGNGDIDAVAAAVWAAVEPLLAEHR